MGNDLIAIRKNKHALKLNKPAYIGIYVLILSLAIMYQFHYDCIKNKYSKSKLLFTEIDSLIYETKTQVVYEDFISDKEMFAFSSCLTKWKYCDNSNKLVISKMKDKTESVWIEEFFGAKM